MLRAMARRLFLFALLATGCMDAGPYCGLPAEAHVVRQPHELLQRFAERADLLVGLQLAGEGFEHVDQRL